MKRCISCVLTAALCLTAIFSLNLKAAAASVPTGAAKVATESTGLNVRKTASTSSAVVTTLKKGSYVTLISKSGSWYYVRYSAAGYGYCSSKYLTEVSSSIKTVKTASGNLNIRATASTSGTIKGGLPSGTKIAVLSVSGSFSKILYDGSKTGYVSSAYLTATTSSTASETASYKAISLSVPSYKQADSRWGSVTLGSSGQTIAKIGCATTALAMSESFRTGTSITPDKMAKKLSYTSGGAVYWPTNYTIVTSSSGYLKTVYSLLKAGKPVVIGAKNSYGGQHYVVIKGVKACTTLTASSFIINDPGSGSRTTLAQFLTAYPNFYKMLYY